MKIRKMAFLSLLSVALTGCSKIKLSQDDYNNENIDNDIVNMTVVNGNSNLYCDISAEIEKSQYFKDEIIPLEMSEWDSNYIEGIGKVLFDHGIYEEIYPYELSDYEELEEQEQFVTSLLDDTLVENAFCSQLEEIQSYKSSEEKKGFQQIEKKGLIYTIESQGDEESPEVTYSKYDICRLRGKINDKYCEMMYFNDGIKCYINITPYVRSYDKIQYYSYIQDNDINMSDFDESQRLILNIVESVGLNVQLAEITNRNVLENSIMQMDGYRFVYVSEYCDKFYVKDLDYAICVESGKVAMQSKLIIDVNQYGIDQIEIMSPFYEIKDKMQVIDMKSIDEINECAANYISSELMSVELFDFYDKSNIVVDKIVFENLIVNKNGNYVCVPVCVYYKKNGLSSYGFNNAESVPWFAVDAIDGTIYKLGVMYENWE